MARAGLVARLDAIPGVSTEDAEAFVRDLEATVSAAASRSATKVVIAGLVATTVLGLIFAGSRT